jgi:integrase
VLTAMLETCCRPGEILSLQWQDVDLETRELTIRAEKAKTRRARRLPISSRLLAILEMRRLDPSGKPFPPDAYVFGNRLGKRLTSIRTAWENAREAAGLKGFQLRDMRHEAASRFEEAGVLTTDVSKFLGPSEPQHDDALPQHHHSPAPARAVASRAGESAIRESCKFLQRDSGLRPARSRRRSAVPAAQVTAFLAT